MRHCSTQEIVVLSSVLATVERRDYKYPTEGAYFRVMSREPLERADLGSPRRPRGAIFPSYS